MYAQPALERKLYAMRYVLVRAPGPRALPAKSCVNVIAFAFGVFVGVREETSSKVTRNEEHVDKGKNIASASCTLCSSYLEIRSTTM